KKIENFTKDYSYEKFMKDEKTVYAVIRCFEIMGEAAKNIPENVKNKFPHIPWKRVAGMRDKLIHGYFGVDYETLWKTITIRIPEIKPLFEKIVSGLEK
ncbi:MAG: DUF86 domain-containing protein, partial [Candidatus Thermoplasmatota archaeon]